MGKEAGRGREGAGPTQRLSSAWPSVINWTSLPVPTMLSREPQASGERMRGGKPAGVREGLLEGEASEESPLERGRGGQPTQRGAGPGVSHPGVLTWT